MRMILWGLALGVFGAWAQDLPEATGRDETIRLCTQCHELARSISLRQDREGWASTISKMTAFGMKGSTSEVKLVHDYLTKTYPAEEVPRVNVNTARAIEIEASLSLRRSQAAALIAYREKNGPFKSIEDLKKVPGLATFPFEAKRYRIAF